MELKTLEEDIKRKIKAAENGFCPSHPYIRIVQTNLFGFRKNIDCTVCSEERKKIIKASSSFDGSHEKLSIHGLNNVKSNSTDLSVERMYQRDESAPEKFVVQYANGDFYEGELLNGKRHGIGVWILLNGDKFEGSFKENRMDGQGLYKYINGDMYQGSYKNGKKHGRGKYTWANGDTYEATFVDGREEGTGVYKWNNPLGTEMDSAEGLSKEDAVSVVCGDIGKTAGDVDSVVDGMNSHGGSDGYNSEDKTSESTLASWSVGVWNDKVGKEEKNEAHLEVLQSAFKDLRNESGGSPTAFAVTATESPDASPKESSVPATALPVESLVAALNAESASQHDCAAGPLPTESGFVTTSIAIAVVDDEDQFFDHAMETDRRQHHSDGFLNIEEDNEKQCESEEGLWGSSVLSSETDSCFENLQESSGDRVTAARRSSSWIGIEDFSWASFRPEQYDEVGDNATEKKFSGHSSQENLEQPISKWDGQIEAPQVQVQNLSETWYSAQEAFSEPRDLEFSVEFAVFSFEADVSYSASMSALADDAVESALGVLMEEQLSSQYNSSLDDFFLEEQAIAGIGRLLFEAVVCEAATEGALEGLEMQEGFLGEAVRAIGGTFISREVLEFTMDEAREAMAVRAEGIATATEDVSTVLIADASGEILHETCEMQISELLHCFAEAEFATCTICWEEVAGEEAVRISDALLRSRDAKVLFSTVEINAEWIAAVVEETAFGVAFESLTSTLTWASELLSSELFSEVETEEILEIGRFEFERCEKENALAVEGLCGILLREICDELLLRMALVDFATVSAVLELCKEVFREEVVAVASLSLSEDGALLDQVLGNVAESLLEFEGDEIFLTAKEALLEWEATIHHNTCLVGSDILENAFVELMLELTNDAVRNRQDEIQITVEMVSCFSLQEIIETIVVEISEKASKENDISISEGTKYSSSSILFGLLNDLSTELVSILLSEYHESIVSGGEAVCNTVLRESEQEMLWEVSSESMAELRSRETRILLSSVESNAELILEVVNEFCFLVASDTLACALNWTSELIISELILELKMEEIFNVARQEHEDRENVIKLATESIHEVFLVEIGDEIALELLLIEFAAISALNGLYSEVCCEEAIAAAWLAHSEDEALFNQTLVEVAVSLLDFGEAIKDEIIVSLQDCLHDREIAIDHNAVLVNDDIGDEVALEILSEVADGAIRCRDCGILLSSEIISWSILLEAVESITVEQISEVVDENDGHILEGIEFTSNIIIFDFLGDVATDILSVFLLEREESIACGIKAVCHSVVFDCVREMLLEFSEEISAYRQSFIQNAIKFVAIDLESELLIDEIGDVASTCLSIRNFAVEEAMTDFLWPLLKEEIIHEFSAVTSSICLQDRTASVTRIEELISLEMIENLRIEVVEEFLSILILQRERSFLDSSEGASEELILDVIGVEILGLASGMLSERDSVVKEIVQEIVLSFLEEVTCQEGQSEARELLLLLQESVAASSDEISGVLMADSILVAAGEIAEVELQARDLSLARGIEVLGDSFCDMAGQQEAQQTAREVVEVMSAETECSEALWRDVADELTYDVSEEEIALEAMVFQIEVAKIAEYLEALFIDGMMEAVVRDALYWQRSLEETTLGNEVHLDSFDKDGYFECSVFENESFEMTFAGQESSFRSIQTHLSSNFRFESIVGEGRLEGSLLDFSSCLEGRDIAFDVDNGDGELLSAVTAAAAAESVGPFCEGSEPSSLELSEGNYSADVETSWDRREQGEGEDFEDDTLNSEAAELLSVLMKRSDVDGSEYSADAEDSFAARTRDDSSEGPSPSNCSDGDMWMGLGTGAAGGLSRDTRQKRPKVNEKCSAENDFNFPSIENGPLVGHVDITPAIAMATPLRAGEVAVPELTFAEREAVMAFESLYPSKSDHSPGTPKWTVSPFLDGKGDLYKHAVIHHENGDVFDGLVDSDGIFQVEGSLSFRNGDLYSGGFSNGKLSGVGKYRYSNGDNYHGEFSQGKKDGRGFYSFQCGDVYYGEYRQDKRHGQGVYKYSNGDIYIGEYCNGKKTTRGFYRYGDGTIHKVPPQRFEQFGDFGD